MTPNKARVYFTLSGYHFNPDGITQHLEIQPTSVNAAGAKSGMDRPAISSWELSTEMVSGDIDVYALTDLIIKQLEPIEEKIQIITKNYNLSARLDVELILSIDKDEITPEVGFGGRATRLLADIGAFINIDYKLSERV